MFFEELEDAIRKVHAGARSLPPVVAERLAERMGGSELTVRELEVLQEIVNGKSNKEIANALHISEATVKSHINNILGKLGVTDRTQAATRALQRGIVRL
jgi:DNA-binding NarL/FixJ family response regulator